MVLFGDVWRELTATWWGFQEAVPTVAALVSGQRRTDTMKQCEKPVIVFIRDHLKNPGPKML